MKRLLLISLALLFIASLAFAQAGFIGLYSDVGYTDCTLLDVGAAVTSVYVVHRFTPGVTASQFMVVSAGYWACVHVAEVVHMPVSIGSSMTGVSLSYGGCLPGDILLITIQWFCQGLTTPCASLEVVPDPAAPTGTIEVIDCTFVKLVGQGGTMYGNPDGSCVCDFPPNPVEQSSWGQIKALYGE